MTTPAQDRSDNVQTTRVLLAALVPLIGLLGAAAGAAGSFGLAYALLHGTGADGITWLAGLVFFGFFGVPAGVVVALVLWRRLFPGAHLRHQEMGPEGRTAIGIGVVVVLLVTAIYVPRLFLGSSPVSSPTDEPSASVDPAAVTPYVHALTGAAQKLCMRSGIRYVSTTGQGAEVCFTLTRDGSELIEIGYIDVQASGCNQGLGDVYADMIDHRQPVDASGQFQNPAGLSLTATIRGATATGLLTGSRNCPDKTFKWSARRTQ